MEYVPFAKARVQVHDRLATLDLSETGRVSMQHLISGLGQESSDVDISYTLAVLQTLGECQLRWVCPHGRHRTWDGRLLLSQSLQILNDVSVGGLHHLERERERPKLGGNHTSVRVTAIHGRNKSGGIIMDLTGVLYLSSLLTFGHIPCSLLVGCPIVHVIVHHIGPRRISTGHDRVDVWINSRGKVRKLTHLIILTRDTIGNKGRDGRNAVENSGIRDQDKWAVVRTVGIRPVHVCVHLNGRGTLWAVELGTRIQSSEKIGQACNTAVTGTRVGGLLVPGAIGCTRLVLVVVSRLGA